MSKLRDRIGAVRQARRTAALYRTFVRPGQLAFDIGAHTGDRTKALLAVGARVVAVEPQPEYAVQIDPRARVLLAAVGSTPGTATLHRAPDAPELATLSQDWVGSIKSRFPEVAFTEHVTVDVTTLDALITEFGRPVFCKVDTEGFDAEVIAGLSTPIRALSYEFAVEAVDVPLRVLTLLSELARYRFAYALGRSMRLSHWMSRSECEQWIRHLPTLDWGDLYAIQQ